MELAGHQQQHLRDQFENVGTSRSELIRMLESESLDAADEDYITNLKGLWTTEPGTFNH